MNRGIGKEQNSIVKMIKFHRKARKEKNKGRRVEKQKEKNKAG